jgi:flagellar protein FliS
MIPNSSYAAMNAYRAVGVESLADTADPHQLVLMLYNGARAAVAAAKGHLQRKEIASKCEAISKAIAIVDGGLKASLDLNVGGPLAQSLSDLYAYMGQRLLEANLHNDGQKLEEVALLLEQLGSAWESIAGKTAPAAAAPASAVRPALALVPAPNAMSPTVRTEHTPTAAAAPSPSSLAPMVSMQSRRLASAYGAF